MIPVTRSKQFPSYDLWWTAPNRCFWILLEVMFLLVSTSKYHIPVQCFVKRKVQLAGDFAANYDKTIKTRILAARIFTQIEKQSNWLPQRLLLAPPC